MQIFLFLLGIEPRRLGRPASILVSIPTELALLGVEKQSEVQSLN